MLVRLFEEEGREELAGLVPVRELVQDVGLELRLELELELEAVLDQLKKELGLLRDL